MVAGQALVKLCGEAVRLTVRVRLRKKNQQVIGEIKRVRAKGAGLGHGLVHPHGIAVQYSNKEGGQGTAALAPSGMPRLQ